MTLWERRWHPLREEWVIVAGHRQARPWSGETLGAEASPPLPAYDPGCYLCPGNPRVGVGGHVNPVYAGTWVFDNDHPCVGPDAPLAPAPPPAPYRVEPALGFARVVCFSPRHDATFATLSLPEVEGVLEVWRRETRDLGQRPGVAHVLCFENKGEVVGVSNPHPHGQIYATGFVWKTMQTEAAAFARHAAQTGGRSLFDEILAAERADGRRILFEDEHVLAFVPYFARYAYEVYVAPKRRVTHIYHLSDAEVGSLAAALQSVTIRFDNLWRLPFPYVQVLHQGPTGADQGPAGAGGSPTREAAPADAFHFFIAFHPPLRQPRVLKYLAGPEIGGGNFLSDTSPEEKAAELRAQSPTVHYASLAPGNSGSAP
jgi:UDPglucose--hexose-1-phosphate uridylyltransferase